MVERDFSAGERSGKPNIAGGVTVHGNVESSGKVYVKKGAHILGDVIAKEIFLDEDAKIDGIIEAPHGMHIGGK